MAENSKIQWTDHTFNPWRGCQKVAAGCANCYAETLSKRNPGTLGIWGPNGTRVLASEEMWSQPKKWNDAATPWILHAELCRLNGIFDPLAEWRRRDEGQDPHVDHRPRVFCASLADVFEDWPRPIVDSKGRAIRDDLLNQDFTLDDVRARLFRLIDSTPNLDWLLLTKRPENVRRMVYAARLATKTHHHCGRCGATRSHGKGDCVGPCLPNCWLGCSIANQEDAERNLPELLKCRDLAAKLFLSIEPLIGPVDLSTWLQLDRCDSRGGGGTDDHGNPYTFRCGLPDGHGGPHSALVPTAMPWSGKACPDWVIVGGESGPNARPCNVKWIRSVVQQCKAAGVPVFVKQLGVKPYQCHGGHDAPIGSYGGGAVDCHGHGGCGCEVLEVRDTKGGDMAEWPEDLRVREFPVSTKGITL